MKTKRAIKQTVPANANFFYPKIVVNDKTKEVRSVEFGPVTFGTDETFFLEPPEQGYGTSYDYLVHSNSEGTFVIKYQQYNNTLYNTGSGSKLDYKFQYNNDITYPLSNLSDNVHVYQLTGYDKLLAASIANTIDLYTWYTNVLDLGTEYLNLKSLYAWDKTTGDVLWSKQDWDSTGTPYYIDNARIVVTFNDIARKNTIWAFNFGTTLYAVTDPRTGAFLTVDLTPYGTYNEMFGLPDGSVLLAPYGTPGGDIARVSYDGTQLVVDNTFGSGSGLNLTFGMDVVCNVAHATDKSAYYVSEYDTITAYSMVDGSVLWTYTRNGSSVDEILWVHPVTGNIICDENTTSTDCDVVELDKSTGAVVHTQHFTEFSDMNSSAMFNDGNIFLAEDEQPQRMGFLDISTTPWTFSAVNINDTTNNLLDWAGYINYQVLPIVSKTNDVAYFVSNNPGGVIAVDYGTKSVVFLPLIAAGKAPPYSGSGHIISAEDNALIYLSDNYLPYKMSVTDLGLPDELSPATPSYSPSGLTDGYYETGNATWGPDKAYYAANSGIYGTDSPTASSPAYVVSGHQTYGASYGFNAFVSEVYDGVMRMKGAVTIPGGPSQITPLGTRADGTIACIVAPATAPVQTGFLDPVNLTWTPGGNLPDNNAQYLYSGANYGTSDLNNDFFLFTAVSNTPATYKNATGTTTWTAATPFPQTVGILTTTYYNSVYYVLGISGTTGYMYTYDSTTDTWTALTAPPALPSSNIGGSAIIEPAGPSILYPRLGQQYDINTDTWTSLTGWNTTIFNKYLRNASGVYWGSTNHGSAVIYVYYSANDDKQITYCYPSAPPLVM